MFWQKPRNLRNEKCMNRILRITEGKSEIVLALMNNSAFNLPFFRGIRSLFAFAMDSNVLCKVEFSICG